MRLQKLVTRIARRINLEYRVLCWEAWSRIRKSITVRTKQGTFTVLLGAEESIGKSLYCNGQYEFDFMSNAIAFLRHEHLVPPKGQGTLVDIGANNGITSVSLLHTGEMEKSIAIEPEPRNFSILQHNVIQNGLKDRVLCLPYAASHQKGELLFELSDSNFGDHRVHTDTLVDSSAERYNESSRRVIKVPSDTVDSLLASLPDTFTTSIAVVWIDVQGYEGYVFMGAEGLLSRGMPVVCEIWPYGIRQAGMSQEKYCDIAKSIWSYYWVMRRGKFVRYPIPILDTYFTELGYEGEFENVIFSH